MSADDAPTENLQRPSQPGIHVRVGRSKMFLSAATVISAGLAAAAGAWGVVKAERDSVWDEIEKGKARDTELASLLAIEQQRGGYMQAQFARIDARLAEIQVILMQQARR